jgi:hypothetical protein
MNNPVLQTTTFRHKTRFETDLGRDICVLTPVIVNMWAILLRRK